MNQVWLGYLACVTRPTAAPSMRATTLNQYSSLLMKWVTSKVTIKNIRIQVMQSFIGYSLGMNHDGERREGNDCNPDKYLMSPILGPGKVTWSQCSNREILAFLNGR